MRRWYFAGVVLVLGLIAASVRMAGGRLTVFVSLGAFALVVLPAVLMSLANFSFVEIGDAFAAAFGSDGSRGGEAARARLERARIFHEALGRYIIGSGVLATFLGVIIMLANLNSEVATVGSGFAIALITVFYSLVLYVVLVVPFRAGIERRLAER